VHLGEIPSAGEDRLIGGVARQYRVFFFLDYYIVTANMQHSESPEEEFTFSFSMADVTAHEPLSVELPEPEVVQNVEEVEEVVQEEMEEVEVAQEEPEVAVQEEEVEVAQDEPEEVVQDEPEEVTQEEPEEVVQEEPEVAVQEEEVEVAQDEPEVAVQEEEVEVEVAQDEPEVAVQEEVAPEVVVQDEPEPEEEVAPEAAEPAEPEVVQEEPKEEPAPEPAQELSFSFDINGSGGEAIYFTPIEVPDAVDRELRFHPENGFQLEIQDISEAMPEVVQEAPKEEPAPEPAPQDDIPPPTPAIPKVIFLVPYRDRLTQQTNFDKKMREVVLKNTPPDDYKIFYIHQLDTRSFNRGAMKNIGFIMVRRAYPQDYQNITLVFNDVDTTPNSPDTIPSYETVPGVIKHFYGFPHALGGIFSILAGDFERINGFPNYWSWGYEDNMLIKRAERAGLAIDRTVFYPNTDTTNIQQTNPTSMRVVNQGEFDRYARNVEEGINTIRQLYYTVNEATGFVNVHQFNTSYDYNPSLDRPFDTSKSNVPFKVGYSAKRRSRLNMVM